MALSVREVLLVLRAKDQASRVIADVGRSFNRAQGAADAAARRQIHAGQALLGVGVAMAATGAAGVAFYTNMAESAVEYDRQAALTLTQVDQVGVSLEDIKNIAKDVGSTVAAPFDQMQTALYDIFSSTNATLPQARTLLEQFSKDAVAGQVDIQDASRATISILNAFKMPLEDVTHVSDVMFQLVRKGRGTYEEFASTIGRAIPSAVRADQSIEDLAGMLAFLTRNGLSTAMASASAARALDSFSNPKVVDRLNKMGIATKNADGSFRSISDVVTDLSKKTAGMKGPEYASFLQELFKGAGGTIQARRFRDIALKDPTALKEFTDNMNNAKGAAQSAYDIMFGQSVAAKIQLLKNNWEILKTEIGEVVIPVLAKFVEILTKIIKWFRNLPEDTKRSIIIFGMIASAALILLGAITGLSGVILILSGVIELLDVAMLPIVGVVMAIVAALILLGIWFYNLYQHSQAFRDFVDSIWQGLQRIVDIFRQFGWRGVLDAFWTNFKTSFHAGIDVIWQDMQAGWDRVLANLPDWGMSLLAWLKKGWDWFAQTGLPWVLEKGGNIADKIWEGITNGAIAGAEWLWSFIAAIGNWIGNHVQDFFEEGLKIGGEIAKGVAHGLLDLFHGVPVLGWAADDISSWLGLKNDPFDNTSGLSAADKLLMNAPEGVRQAISAGITGQTAGLQGSMLPGYAESNVTDVHDNNFFVADLLDLVNQLDQQSRLNNKAVGNAQPTPPSTRTMPAPKAPYSAFAGSVNSKGQYVGNGGILPPRADARTGPR